MKLFVYGTLKRGYGNHRYIQGAEFLGEARLDGYMIYSLGGFPGITPHSERYVIGELYEINDGHLERCDYLEGVDEQHPERGMYRRETVNVLETQGEFRGYGHAAEVYIYNGRAGTPIDNGRWER